MRRDLLVGGLSLLVIIGLAFYVTSRPASAPGTTATSTPGVGASLPPLKFTEHAPYYDIAANYPTSTPLRASVGPAADAAAVGSMRDFVASTIDQFKKDGNFANLTPQDISMMGFDQGRKEKLQLTYLISSSPHTVSYIFTLYMDTLGAHGNMFFHTFTFDTMTGAPVSITDLFTAGAPYLDTLSKLSREKLPGVIGKFADPSFIETGTGPEEKNFQNFFIDNANLALLFPPYQVAPYAAGPQTLYIPLSELGNILKPEYRP